MLFIYTDKVCCVHVEINTDDKMQVFFQGGEGKETTGTSSREYIVEIEIRE